MNKQPIIIIVGMTKKRIIGKGNELPWHISEDLKHFKRQTTGNTVIMGHNTYLSLHRPSLPNRNNIVISPELESNEHITVCRNLDDALETGQSLNRPIFIIGGAYTYEHALPYVDYLYISWVKKDYEGDVYFPIFDVDYWTKESSEDFGEFVFIKYKRK
ncbi:MAG: dihydrofolate reductase [Candidatus Neomarinimicrobiota bacterium]|nr:dihydrofolate reductase [Candidatus Neomarinimicrobiota bacterium]RKY53388.1 MAG: dihydrofolate reductase [Candidatus Neomarinimicrobiota bacterium]